MKSIAQTAGILTKLQMKNSVATWSLRSTQSKSCLYSLNRDICYQRTAAASSTLTTKRSITSDSWGAAGLTKKGEILTSANHKQNIVIDEEYMEGKPPAEVIKICNEMLKLNVIDYYRLMNNVTVSVFPEAATAVSLLLLLYIPFPNSKFFHLWDCRQESACQMKNCWRV